MLRLYYKPGACALASHIALREAGLSQVPVVRAAKGKLDDGSDFSRINPKGYTPALELEDGQILTESAVVLQYIGDRAPAARLVSAPGSLERYREQEWLNYIATELHKGFGPLFNPKVTGDSRAALRDALAAKFDYVSSQLGSKPYLFGDRFTVADAYLYTILRWAKEPHADLARWPVLVAYRDRVGSRPAVQRALHEEGL